MSEQPLEDKLMEALRAADQTVPKIISTLRETAPAMIATQQEIQRRFEKRLADRWREPFQLYHMVLTCAREMVADFDREHRDESG